MTTPGLLNPEADERYLFALLFSATTRPLALDALAQVSPDDLYDPHLSAAWKAAQALAEAGERITPRAVRAACGSPAVDARVLVALDAIPHPGDYPAAVAEVTRCGTLRRIDQMLMRARQRAHAAPDVGSAVDVVREEIDALARVDTPAAGRRYGDLLDQWMAEEQNPDPALITPTPWDDVNALLAGGLRAGRFYVVGARPGDGKSIASHQIAHNAAAHGRESIVFSLEMGAMEVTGRMISAGAQVDMGEVARQRLSAESLIRMREYADRARRWPLTVVDRADVTMPWLRAACRTHRARHGLDVVCVDYLQLITPEARGRENREQQVSAISRQLKLLSRELGCAVVVPAQLNRETVSRGGKPRMSDLRESGGIESDADVVMLLARGTYPADHGEWAGEPTGDLDVVIGKNRFGPTAQLTLPWRPHFSTIG